MTLERLDWDSNFFHLSIARAVTPESVADLADQAAAERLDCVYIESPTRLDAAGHDLRLTDHRVTLRARVEGGHTDTPGAARLATGADRPHLEPALDRLAPWSRFARDDGFGLAAARRMYDAWLDRALRGENECVGVFPTDGTPMGFVTLTTGRHAEIGLIGTAVDGSGAGRALIAWAKSQLSPDATLDVGTQADNARAVGLYEQTGFVRQAESFMYHLWPKTRTGDD